MGMGEEILQELKRKLEKSLEVVRDDLATIRAGRAKPALIENVKVEAYGGVMELRELATITAPSADLLVVAPWDKSLVGAINKGIQAANLGLNPIVEGDQLKVPVPTLTEERRSLRFLVICSTLVFFGLYKHFRNSNIYCTSIIGTEDL